MTTKVTTHTNSLLGDAWNTLKKNRAALVSVTTMATMIALVIFGPLLSPYAVDQTDWYQISSRPNLASGHIFGTDDLGRDLFVRVMYGGRVSLMVGIVATIVSVIIGVTYGSISGFIGGKTDALMMRVVDVLYAMPFLFFVILLMVFFGRSILLIFVAIGAVNWLDIARIVRGQTLNLKGKEFVDAARAGGASTLRIVFKHIVPNLLGLVVVYVALTVPQVILVESFLSFLGLGVQEPMTSWGALVNQGARQMETSPWMLLFPAMFLATTLFCFNFIGDGLRDALDPKDRTREEE
ncbi:MAG TPA: ABC transporter permease subunit [Gammaproteobacteria bacterium]|jgi:oligopeptide transport system permease protein|nr:ABC transporter permease subunit [Gammaproteobacteria bacterium]|tara:strand:+ start:506 stop:1390 length:885 start_codon:yes stop_codon:yes gene_type:complete